MKFIGGHPCLDFVNTVGGRVRAPGVWANREYSDIVVRDKLMSFGDLVTFSRLAGLLTAKEANTLARRAARHPRSAARILARAAKLRKALHHILQCRVEGWRPEDRDLDIVNRELANARNHERLTRSGNAVVWNWDDSEDALDGVLWRISRSAADLLTSSGLARLRQCGGEECGWIFLDTSRNHTRRWCDMKDCGNRAKVREFRLRLAREGEPH